MQTLFYSFIYFCLGKKFLKAACATVISPLLFLFFSSLEFKTIGCTELTYEHVLLAKQADMTSKTEQRCAKNAMENSQLFLLTLLKQSFTLQHQCKAKEGSRGVKQGTDKK